MLGHDVLRALVHINHCVGLYDIQYVLMATFSMFQWYALSQVLRIFTHVIIVLVCGFAHVIIVLICE